MTQLIFWLCIFGATYSYFWYPALLLVLPRRSRQPGGARLPVHRIAIIIAARNEEGKIAGKLRNTLELERAYLDVDILVASDASDDSTDRIVLEFADRGVRLVRSDVRRGKEHAQGLAIAATNADLLVFTDSGTILAQDALIRLVEAFRDSTVGAVSSIDQFITEDGSLQGEGAYVRYEMWLRDLESRYFSLVGLSGSFFAARGSVCQALDIRVPSDFGTALSCVQQGLRAVSDRRVVGYYKNLADPRREYQRKLRTIVRGMNGLLRRRDVLNFARNRRFAFQVFSHKVMRWSVPWFLIGALCSNIVLASESQLYGALLAAQGAFYCLPVVTSAVPALRRFGFVRLCIFFIEANLATIHATFLTISGRAILSWEPSRR